MRFRSNLRCAGLMYVLIYLSLCTNRPVRKATATGQTACGSLIDRKIVIFVTSAHSGHEASSLAFSESQRPFGPVINGQRTLISLRILESAQLYRHPLTGICLNNLEITRRLVSTRTTQCSGSVHPLMISIHRLCIYILSGDMTLVSLKLHALSCIVYRPHCNWQISYGQYTQGDSKRIFRGFYSGVAEDSSLLGCQAVSLDKQLPVLQNILLPLYLGSSSPKSDILTLNMKETQSFKSWKLFTSDTAQHPRKPGSRRHEK